MVHFNKTAWFVAALCSASGLAMWGGEAGAQEQSYFERDRNISVEERWEGRTSDIYLRFGAFAVSPQLEAAAGYDSNVFAQSDNETSDVLARLRPRVDVRSLWSRHALNASAYVEREEYASEDSESGEEYGAALSGRLDVSRGLRIEAGAGYDRFREDRGNISTPLGAAERVEADLVNASLAGVYETGRARLRLAAAVLDFDYDDTPAIGGGVIDQDLRDFQLTEISGRAEYALSPALAAFVGASGNWRDYDQVDPFVGTRDSQGAVIDAGLNFDITAVVRGEIAAGLLEQSYDAPGASDVTGLSLAGLVEWFPTGLTTVRFEAERGVSDNGVFGSFGTEYDFAAVRVDHELLRNTILSARTSYRQEDLLGLNREDDRIEAGFGARYALGERGVMFADYRYADQDSSDPSGLSSWSDHNGELGLAWRF